jgi:uncharacterized membrane protein YkvA (DUF1232 family)
MIAVTGVMAGAQDQTPRSRRYGWVCGRANPEGGLGRSLLLDRLRVWRRVAVVCAGILFGVTPAASVNAGLVPVGPGGAIVSVDGGAVRSKGPLSRPLHKIARHAEKAVARLVNAFTAAGGLWLSLLVSGLVFLLVVAVSSAVDVRMLAPRRVRPWALLGYVGRGTLTFLRILRDRRTPRIARVLLLVALVYWLIPRDLIPDNTVVPGFVDDLLIAVVAAKAFIHLCPDSLVARHARVVETRV